METSFLKDLVYDLDNYTNDVQVNSVYFGGGTPSLARVQLVEQLLNAISSRITLSPNTEITLEANPTQIETTKLKDFKAAGVNRLSLGMQVSRYNKALDEHALSFFGRDHTVKQGLESVEKAKTVFKNISLDFIWGRPGQSLGSWQTELHLITKLNPQHLSLYQLTVEKGTRLYNDVQNGLKMPADDELADMYDLTQQIPGYAQYEVSSFSKSEATQSKHNKGYWKGDDYIGIGPGAHGRLTVDQQRFRTFRIPSPDHWMNQIQTSGHGIRKKQQLSMNEVGQELVVFGLRMIDGIDGTRFKELSKYEMDEVFCFNCQILDPEQVHELESLNLIQVQRDGTKIVNLKPTHAGLAVADRIISKIVKI